MSQLWSILKSVAEHPANQHSVPSQLWRALLWQWHKQISKSPLDINYHGLRFRCFPESTFSSSIAYFNGLPDYNEMCFIKRYLRKGDAFLDIGANVGAYSLLAASEVGNTGRVDAFEAMPTSAQRVTDQIKLNKLEAVINLHTRAVSNKNTQLQFAHTQNDCTSRIQTSEDSDESTLTVEAVTLDSYLPTHTYAMAKMDIEGAEMLALQGAHNHLSEANPPVWQIEAAGYSKLFGTETHELLDFARSYGFKIMAYEASNNHLIDMPRPWECDRQNVLLIHQDYYDHVVERLNC